MPVKACSVKTVSPMPVKNLSFKIKAVSAGRAKSNIETPTTL
jgi:hypothetical protein